MKLLWNASVMKGLWHLCDIFPSLKAKIPDAELFIVSDLDAWMQRVRYAHNAQGLHVQQIATRLLGTPGVYHLGPLPLSACARLPEMDAVLFPVDPSLQLPFTRDGMMRMVLAVDQGATVIASDFPDLKEALPWAHFLEVPIWHEGWVQFLGGGVEKRTGPVTFAGNLSDKPEFLT